MGRIINNALTVIGVVLLFFGVIITIQNPPSFLKTVLFPAAPTPKPITLVVPVTQVVPSTQVVPVTQVPSVLVFQVFANKGWQDTGIVVRRGQQITIEYISGQWTYWTGQIQPFDANGDNFVCAFSRCAEPLPSGRKGALIGKVGSEVFFVGNHATFTSQSSGVLLLRMNDTDDGLYDNSGSVVIRVTASVSQ